ncbi:hypothetical protein FOA43_002940 [Brettanomyces nanus]|uniref:Uncharacterized protein n=1 Tax=Eeniella nana TaxID=13502 RepID=A0A875S3W0_EENNA|nr:uncharacterized protein FOA43_002940 [Brettanomyces nanus]QPG75583.1 hypothetical protein FOA43_002940 [Brettanomyces nanus]
MFALKNSLKYAPRLGISPLFLKNSFNLSKRVNGKSFSSYGWKSHYDHSSRASKGVVIGLMGISATYLINHNPIRNDSALAYSQGPTTPKGYQYVKIPEKPKYDGAFGGRLNYKQLALGSIFGMLSGLIAGQLSSLFVFFSLGVYLAAQYLHAQGVLTIPMTKIVRIGTEDIDIRQMVFEQPSFSITYVLSFLIAAYNS